MMKRKSLNFAFIATAIPVLMSFSSWANAEKASEKHGKPMAPSAKSVSRDLVFSGSSVNGRYQSAGEAVAKVEQEKKMNALIGLRSDYKDRLKTERDRLRRGEAAAVR